MEALATKHRPQMFHDVCGQVNIIRILQNQIKNGSIKQAYLFTGGAGTGKTTTARIFAREINEAGLKSSNNADIIEIDAASNNGVDNVRELRETCKFKPLVGKYKVYIIDEVHMLSTGAFNALLKTLEEPPAHAVFILCTTDPQKIPATIISRVQRFDFKRMATDEIVGRLKRIIAQENDETDPSGAVDFYEVSDDAFEYIAKLANGGMRDAISLLDTCVGYKPDLQLEDVIEILGSTSIATYIRLLQAIDGSQFKHIIEIIEEVHTNGKDLKVFVKGLLEFIVEVLKYDMFGDFTHISLPTSSQELLDRLLKCLDATNDIKLREWFKCINALYHRVKYESQPRTLIEGELICLCKPTNKNTPPWE